MSNTHPWFTLVSNTCPWFTLVSNTCPWFTLVSNTCPWFTLVSNTCPWFTLVSNTCPWFTLVSNITLVISLSLAETISYLRGHAWASQHLHCDSPCSSSCDNFLFITFIFCFTTLVVGYLAYGVLKGVLHYYNTIFTWCVQLFTYLHWYVVIM